MNETLYDELGVLAAALAHPKRLRALNLLIQGPKPIDALAELLAESPANTAAMMKILRAAGLVRAERDGKHVYQHVSDEGVVRLFLELRRTGETLRPAVARLRDELDAESSSLEPNELEPLVASKKALLIDLRPSDEYEEAHIPGARSLPFTELERSITSLPRRRRIFTYCRGRYCPNGRKSARFLADAGLRVEALRFGVAEWRAAGNALVRGGAR